jgi:hypothetical protein
MTRVSLHRRHLLWPLLLALPVGAQTPKGGAAYPPQIEGTQVKVYKTASDVPLKV